MKTKIKVSVPELIAAIEARRSEAERAYNAAVEEYPSALAEWQTEAVKTLADWGAAVARMEQPRTDRYTTALTFPARPSEPRVDLSGYDRDLATLRIAADASLLISAEDYGRYLK